MDDSVVFATWRIQLNRIRICIRQVAPVRTSSTKCFHRPTLVESTTKRHLDRFSHFCTAHGKVSSGMPGHVFPLKNYTYAWGDLEPHLIHDSLSQPSPNPERRLDRFSRFLCKAHKAESRYTLQRAVPFSPYNCLFSWGIRIPI